MLRKGYIRTTGIVSMSNDLHEFFNEFDKDITGINGRKNTIKEAVIRKCSTLEHFIREEFPASWNNTPEKVLRAVVERAKGINDKYHGYHVEKLHDHLALVILEVEE